MVNESISTSNLFEPTDEVCPICESVNIFKLNNMLVCSDCGDYLIINPIGNIKETFRTFRPKTKNG